MSAAKQRNRSQRRPVGYPREYGNVGEGRAQGARGHDAPAGNAAAGPIRLDRLAAYREPQSTLPRQAGSRAGGSSPAESGRVGSAVRDLLDLDVDVAALLPADDANHGFDNNADSLRISPALLEGYLAASRKIARLAVGDPDVTPALLHLRVKPDLGQDSHIEGLPLGTRGGLLIATYFPLDATYVFKTRLALNTSAKVRGLDFEHRSSSPSMA